MNTYTAAVMPWGFEREATAETEKTARRMIWNDLTDEQRDNCQCIDVVDERAASDSETVAALAGMYRVG